MKIEDIELDLRLVGFSACGDLAPAFASLPMNWSPSWFLATHFGTLIFDCPKTRQGKRVRL